MTEEEKAETGKKIEAHVSKYKEKIVKSIVKLMKEYPIIGAVNMEGMPASSLQSMRAQLRGQVVISMTKRRVMRYAFDEVKNEKKDIEKLIPHLKGMPALLFTKENPFKLFKVIKQNKTPAPAKPGQIAPKDISVKAGPTPFAPGPVIGELGAIGIKSEVKDGKIHIKEDSIIVKEGEEIKANVAGMLTRLGIEPMEIGLDLVAVYEDGVIYDKKVLDIDEEGFMNNLNNAIRWGFNLAVEIGHFTKETVSAMIPKAFRESKSVALEAGVMNDATKEELLAKAEAQASALKAEAKIPDAPAKEGKKEPEKKEEAKAEEKPAEEKKEEAPKEEKKEEPKAEEAPKEEAKAEEPKAEEKPKEKEKPADEPKKEEVKEEQKAEEAPKAEEKPAEEKKEALEEKQEEIVEELKEIKEEVKEEEKDPDLKEVKKIEKEVEKVEEKQVEVDKEKQKLPSTEKVILNAIDKNKEAKKPVVEKKEGTPERVIDPDKQKQAKEGEEMFEKLKQKGTLRGIEEDEKKVEGPKTPEEIIEQARKKQMEKQDEVPSAHDLLKRKQQQNK